MVHKILSSRFFVVVFATSVALPPALSSVASAAAPTVGVTHGTVKIRPQDAVPSSTGATLAAAQNEFEPFQIAVGGGDGGVTGVSATASDLTGPGGATLAAANLRLYREAYLNEATPSSSDTTAGRWPDALIPAVDELYGEPRNAFPFDVPAGENRVIWADVYVPQGTAPGAYSGQITLVGSGLGTVTVPVSLTVEPFALPSTSSLPTAFGLEWDAPCVQEQGSYAACGDAGVEASHIRYATFALDHRITLDTVYDGPTQNADGSFDWSHFDATYGQLLDGTAQTILPGAKQTTLRYRWVQDAAHYGAWAVHTRAKGWFDRTFDYTCDEPPKGCAWSDIPARAAIVHQGDPSFPTLVTATISDATTNGVLDAIDLLAPNVPFVWDKGGSDTRPAYDAWLGGGGKGLFWYQSCTSHSCDGSMGDYYTGWPSYMVEASAAQNRAMEWESYVERMQGELYFSTTTAYAVGNDPWSNQYYFAGNGDGTLFYPGTPAKIGGSDAVPVASIRLKLIREGLEDYEYLKLLEGLGHGDDALSIARSVVANTSTIASGDAFMAARAKLAGEIAGIVSPGWSPGSSSGSSGSSSSGSGSSSGGSGGASSSGGSGGATGAPASDPGAAQAGPSGGGGCGVAPTTRATTVSREGTADGLWGLLALVALLALRQPRALVARIGRSRKETRRSPTGDDRRVL